MKEWDNVVAQVPVQAQIDVSAGSRMDEEMPPASLANVPQQ